MVGIIALYHVCAGFSSWVSLPYYPPPPPPPFLILIRLDCLNRLNYGRGTWGRR